MSYFSMMTSRVSQETLIGKNIASTANVQINDPSAAAYIADGEIVVLDYNSVPLTAGTTITDSPFIQLVQRSGATASTADLKYSARINGQKVFAYVGTPGVAANSGQIHTVGYNNTSGSIDTTALSRFLRVNYKFDDVFWSEQANRKSYLSTATTVTQVGITDDIIPIMNQDSYNALMNNGASSGYISAVRLTDSVITADASTGTVVKGSPSMTVTAANANVGEYLRIGTATTGPVYKLIAINGLVYTLDTPFQGTSAAGVNIDRITAASALAGNWGIQMTGLALTFSQLPYGDVPLMVTIWDTLIDGWGTTTLTKTQEATFGTGTYEQVTQLSLMGNMMRGAQFIYDIPLPNSTNDAVSGTLYDGVYISYADISDLGVVSGTKPSEHQTYLFFYNDSLQKGTVVSLLNDWMASTPNAFTNIAP